MLLSKRNLLLGAGGTMLLVGVGGAYSVFRPPTTALAAWIPRSTETDDVRLFAFGHAILAPNPHNRQPWQIKLVGDSQAVITCDLGRRLPVTDPFDRQITIGFGCFLEIARIAAAERGYRAEITAFPDGAATDSLDQRPVAHLSFSKMTVPSDPLFKAILDRRSVKRPFQMDRPVRQDHLDSIARAGEANVDAVTSSETAFVQRISALAWQAWRIESEPRTWRESVDLMRIGTAEIEKNPDGVSIGGPMMNILSATGQVTREQLATPGSTAFNTGVERYKAIFPATPAYLWLRTPGDSRQEQIAVGQAYVRANLAATALGLSMHPVSQALQEYPEMEATRREMELVLGGKRIHMLARLGYTDPVPPTPRWPLTTKLMA